MGNVEARTSSPGSTHDTLHCSHCAGGKGTCACISCERSLIAHCTRQHCSHCTGLTDNCTCKQHCERSSYAICTPLWNPEPRSVLSYAVVVTDGEDTHSSKRIEDAAVAIRALNMLNVKVILAGVGLDGDGRMALEVLDRCGDEDTSFVALNGADDIADLFQRISLSIQRRVQTTTETGLVFVNGQLAAFTRETPSVTQTLQLSKNLLNVWFILDRSGSMAGTKWIKLIQGVNSCLNQLEPDDYVGVVTFSEKVEVILAGRKRDLNFSVLSRITPNGNTALYDGMVVGLGRCLMQQKELKESF